MPFVGEGYLPARYPQRVSFEISSTSPEGPISVTYRGEVDPRTQSITVQLAEHDDVEVHWTASSALSQTVDGSWTGVIELGTPIPDGGRLLEITSARPLLRLPDAGTQEADLVVPDLGMEIVQPEDSQLFLQRQQPGPWATGADAHAARELRHNEREERYSGPVTVPGAVGTLKFAGVLLVEDLLLTHVNRVHGITLLPLTQSSIGDDVARVLNDVLPPLGYSAHIPPDQWAEKTQSKVVIAHFPDVRADSLDEAAVFIQNRCTTMLDLLALRRGARGSLRGGVVIGWTEPDQISLAPVGIRRQYRGNLIGGFAAGEDARSLIADWDRVAGDPRTRLWLSLYSDAIADNRPDHRFFRLFSMLESIAHSVLPADTPILDDNDEVREMPDGQPYTMAQARGSVYALARRMAVDLGTHVNNWAVSFSAPDPEHPESRVLVAGDLWDQIGLWVKLRNIVAHDGSMRLEPGALPSSERRHLDRKVARLSDPPGDQNRGYERLEFALRTFAQTTIQHFLRGSGLS